MKVKRLGILLLFAAVLIVGCGEKKETEKENTFSVYYVDADESKLVPVSYTPKGTSPEKQVTELMKQLTQVDANMEYKSAMGRRIKVEAYKLEDKQLYINFNTHYLDMKPAQEVLLRAAIVRTMMQINGVDCVSFYVDEAPLLDAKGNLVGIMTGDTFVENLGQQINKIETKNIILYFASQDGTGLVAEQQKVYGSSNMSMEKLIMQHLMKGPKEKELRKTIPGGTKLLSVSTLDGVCFVNLDSGYMKQNYELSEAVVVYSIVNSLSELSTVNKVQISVNGDTNMTYRTDFKFDVLYERDLDLVVNMTKEATEEDASGD